jgi:hypothetical protein
VELTSAQARQRPRPPGFRLPAVGAHDTRRSALLDGQRSSVIVVLGYGGSGSAERPRAVNIVISSDKLMRS